jgi:hypothetical protein
MSEHEKQYNCYQLAALGKFFVEVAKKYVEDAEKEVLDRGSADAYMEKFNESCEEAIRHCASAISYTLRAEDPELLPVRAASFYCVADAYREKMHYHDVLLNRKAASLKWLQKEMKKAVFTKNEEFIREKRDSFSKRLADVEAESKRKKRCCEKAERAFKMAKAAEKEYVGYLEAAEEKRQKEQTPKEPLIRRIGLNNIKDNGERFLT